MKKVSLLLFALMLSVLGASDAMAQKIYRAQLDKSMFKAWTSNEPGATVVVNPDPIDDYGNWFGCETNLYKEVEVGNGTVIFGNYNVYYLWYADLTGTQKIHFKGTDGVQLRVLLNRPEPYEGGDAHGGATVEKNVTIGADGTATLDVSDLEYVHLNCIKIGWGSPTGIVYSIELEGTVKPVTGILSVINNGDAEGDDLSSFPVSYDGPNNGGTASERPEIVAGEGVNGSRCFKVTAHDNPSETWHSQIYFMADEVMPKGSKWKLKMAIKADEDAMISTSAQSQPRTWKGSMGIEDFSVTTEWKNYTWTGEIGVDEFQSIAFDLNNDHGTAGYQGVSFYFDNIEFGYDLGGGEATDYFKAFFDGDVIRVDLTDGTNLKDLVKAVPGGQFLMFPEGTAVVKQGGEELPIVSVEGRPDGYLYIFLDAVLDEYEPVEIAFNNPETADCYLKFIGGEFAGQAVPSFSGFAAEYLDGAGNGNISHIYEVPNFIESVPEVGSFNLPGDMKTFIVKFDNPVNIDKLVAKLGNEVLTKAYVDGSLKQVLLTRTSAYELKGSYTLTLENIASTEDIIDETTSAKIQYSFGSVVIDENDQVTVIYESNFSGNGDNAYGAGWYVNAGAALQPANSGSGCRIMHNQGAFAEDLVYIAQRDAANGGVAVYGIDEENKLALEAGKTYHVTLKACRHDRTDVALRVQVLAEDDVDHDNGSLVGGATVLAEDFKTITPEKTSKQAVSFDLAVTPEEAGNFVIRLVPSKENGSFAGYDDPVCFGDVKVEYIPNVLGIVETQALNAALENATNVMTQNSDERYDGADFTTLKTLIETVNAEKATYSAPSVYSAQTAALNAAAKALTDYRAACDAYDKAIQETLDLVMKFKETKFAPTTYYQDLVNTAAKYHAYAEEVTETIVNEETGEEETITNYVKHFDLLKDNASLAEASTLVANANDIVKKMFTEGQSHNWYGGGDRTYGYAALHERLRRGVDLLNTLGFGDNDPVIAKANSVLGDDDEVADMIMKRATAQIYADLANGEASTLFKPIVDEETGEEIGDAEALDMSVFVKNPNVYSPACSTELPGWTSVLGNCGAFPGWGAEHTVNTPYPEDCHIHAGWHPNGGAIAEQTIVNLPAGIYTIHFDCSDNAGGTAGTYAFVRTSENEVPEGFVMYPEDEDYYFAGTIPGAGSGDIEEIVVTDGKLTVGYSYGPESQAFLNEVTIKMVAPAPDFDYAKAYQELDPIVIPTENKKGDVNHDKQVDVTDAVLIIDHILLKNPQNFDATLADVNSDKEIDVTDVVMVIDNILGKIELSRGATRAEKDLSAYTAFQMDLTVPAGYVLEGVELTEIAKDSHKLAYNILSDGRCRVVVFSMDNEALPGAWDEVIRLNLRGQGDAFVNVDRAMFVTVGGERHELLLNGTTSIAQLSTLNSQFSIVYDLTGRKVEKTAKGVYVIDGKKVVK